MREAISPANQSGGEWIAAGGCTGVTD